MTVSTAEIITTNQAIQLVGNVKKLMEITGNSYCQAWRVFKGQCEIPEPTRELIMIKMGSHSQFGPN